MPRVARPSHHAESLTVFLLLFLLAFSLTAQAQSLDSAKLAGIEVRAIGPAAMSGRITAIDAVEK